MIRAIGIVCFGALVCLGTLVVSHRFPSFNPFGVGTTTFSSTGPTIDELKKLSVLTSLRIHVGDVMQAEGGGYKGAWIVKGDAMVGVDLDQAKIDPQPDTKKATIELPYPHVVMARVDHEKTKTYDISSNSWRNWVPGLGGDADAIRDDAMKKAQQNIEEIAASKEYIGLAKESAEQTIRNFFKITGWEVTILWQQNPSTSSPNAAP